MTLSNGQASIPVSSLSAGPHQIEAFYTSNSATFLNSDDSSAPLQFMVATAPLTVSASGTQTYGRRQSNPDAHV